MKRMFDADKFDAVITVKFLEPVMTPALRKMQEIKFSANARGRQNFCEWGDFAANFWFTSAFGKTMRSTCANAVGRIRAMFPGAEIKCCLNGQEFGYLKGKIK